MARFGGGATIPAGDGTRLGRKNPHCASTINRSTEGAIPAAIFHFGEYTVGQARDYLRERGVPVRQ